MRFEESDNDWEQEEGYVGVDKEGEDFDPEEGSGSLEIELSLSELWEADPRLYTILHNSRSIDTARSDLFDLFSQREWYIHSTECSWDRLEKANALSCLKVLKNCLSPDNERISGTSSLFYLRGLARGDAKVRESVKNGFVMEFVHLLRGSYGKSGIYRHAAPPFLDYSGRKAALIRSDHLDELAAKFVERIRSYPSGMEEAIAKKRAENRDRMLAYFNGDPADWNDYRWHLRHVVRTLQVLQDLIDLTPDEREAVRLAEKHRIPFGITPYYLSLMDNDASRTYDHAVRAQVIPPLSYIQAILGNRRDRRSLDFMKEGETSPIDLVTRRYPMIAVVKPYNTCAQICVYCQRNWEVKEVLHPTALAPPSKLEEAMNWFEDHPMVQEVLVTGGDPALMDEDLLDKLFSRLAGMPHVERIRLGTRLPVVLPMRFTDHFVEVLGKYHEPPVRDMLVVTHYEHPYEVTAESMAAVQKLKKAGLSVYNQQVFTMENCRRFETVALRFALKRIGVDPYYTFNTKGKEETNDYRVPIARILQERKEEARTIPGQVRTDEPVFNIPAIGKSHLREGQHHDLIMISPQGERVYEFHPWEKNITLAPTYVYRDVPILDFLDRLLERGENPSDYSSIWYYF